MRSIIFSLIASLALGFSSSASAQCFGDAAQAYGCGVSAPREGTLQTFGTAGKPVVPYYGPKGRSPFDGLFTPWEQRQMLRGIVMNNMTRARFANQAFQRSVNSNANPIRLGTNSSVGVWFGGGIGW